MERGREYNDGVSDTGDCRGRLANSCFCQLFSFDITFDIANMLIS